MSPYELYSDVGRWLEQYARTGGNLEYIVFVPDGEPTLDRNLAAEIRLLRQFGYKIAVISNASLLWNPLVQEDLLFADYVRLKIDTVHEPTWRLLNRPHRRLRLDLILYGIEELARDSRAILTTETVLVNEMNDTPDEIKGLATFVAGLRGRRSSFVVTPSSPARLSQPQDCAQIVMDVAPEAVVIPSSLPDEFALGATTVAAPPTPR